MKRRLLTGAVATVLAGSLAACSPEPRPNDGPNRPGESNSSSAPTETESPEEPAGPTDEELIARASELAQGYDYKAALAEIKDVSSPEADAARTEIESAKAAAKVWPTPNQIPHLFFHSLVVDTDRAFDGDDRQQGYLDYMVTLTEFNAILDELYARDYVLVNPKYFAGLNKEKKMAYRDIKLPEGKKPLVISVDDMSYYEYMDGDGFATKSVLTEDGSVLNEYTTADGEVKIGAYDVQAVVDEFVDEHPDFSYRGSKGILALTGYNGVFGYRTSDREYGDSPTLESDKAEATKIADALKEDGWVMASHSWGHRSMGTVPMDKMKFDLNLWDKEVRPILGKTDQFIYAFGGDISGVPPYSGPRYELLREHGFRFFYGVDGTTTAWMQQGAGYQRQMRINIDGLQFAKELKGDRPVLSTFFDVKTVMDPARP